MINPIAFRQNFYLPLKDEAFTNAIALPTLLLPELTLLFNEINSEMGYPGKIQFFKDKESAVSRIWDSLEEYSQKSQQESIKTSGETMIIPTSPEVIEKKEIYRKPRVRRFTLTPSEKARQVKDPNTLRARCAILLKDGATFEDVKNLVRQFNEERQKPASEEKVERRAYELVRIMHYYLGYGIKHDLETGFITLYEKN